MAASESQGGCGSSTIQGASWLCMIESMSSTLTRLVDGAREGMRANEFPFLAVYSGLSNRRSSSDTLSSPARASSDVTMGPTEYI